MPRMSSTMFVASVIVFYLLQSSVAHLSFYLNETETTRLLGMHFVDKLDNVMLLSVLLNAVLY